MCRIWLDVYKRQALVIVGAVFYKEKVTLKRLVGIIMCIVGVILISEI